MYTCTTMHTNNRMNTKKVKKKLAAQIAADFKEESEFRGKDEELIKALEEILVKTRLAMKKVRQAKGKRK